MISVTESRKAFLGSLAINLNGFLRKFCGTGTAGSIDVFRKCSACPIHLPQLIQDHLGTVIVVLCDKLLQLLHLCLHFRVRRVFALHPAECRHDVHQLTAHVLNLFLGLMGSFFLKLFVFRRFAPFLFGLLGILFDLLRIKCGKVHNHSSCGSNFLRKADQIFKMLLFQCQKANSAILHAGYDPEPGTRMARLNVEGSALAKEICARLDVPYLQCGSLVLALSPEELPHLQKLYENGIANGVPGIRLLSAEETLAMEPNLAPTVVGALYAPSAAIVSPWEFALAMAEVAVHNGVELHRSCPVTRIEKTAGGWALTTPSGIVETRYIINAAGISAQAVHDMAAPHKFTIQPTRGEYYLLDKSEGSRVHHVIFQCPNENGKGVLVAPTVHGNLIVGPNADPVEGDDTACTAAGLAFVSAAARRSVPNIRFSESIRNFAGVRANVDTGDFVIGEAEGAPGFIDLAGMKSPGLSSAPAVAREAVKILEAHGDLPAPKADYRDGRTRVRFKELPPEEKARLIAKEPAYGRVICRCETITEGEILDALHEEIPATTIDGVKRRCGAGMGRCQGGFCGPRVLELISKTLGISPLDVLQDKAGTNVLLCETKQEGEHHD